MLLSLPPESRNIFQNFRAHLSMPEPGDVCHICPISPQPDPWRNLFWPDCSLGQSSWAEENSRTTVTTVRYSSHTPCLLYESGGHTGNQFFTCFCYISMPTGCPKSVRNPFYQHLATWSHLQFQTCSGINPFN